MLKSSRYPSFNVMNELDEWDDHTQTIVSSRLQANTSLQILTPEEAETLRQISSILVSDSTAEVLDFVIEHVDRTLYKSPGEGQRKKGVPEASELVRSGLQAIDAGARELYGSSFQELDAASQKQYLQSVSESTAEPADIWSAIPQEPLFAKLLQLTVESYCSHPRIWSEIGYAGPAYPRGYVRTQLGQLDPWEAQPEHDT